MLPDCSREYLLKNISWGSIPPNPPSKFTAAPLDRQISVFIAKTQSHAWKNVPPAVPSQYMAVLSRLPTAAWSGIYPGYNEQFMPLVSLPNTI